MNRTRIGLVLAAVAASMGGIFGAGAPGTGVGLESQRATNPNSSDPARPVAATVTSNSAKLRDLSFSRVRKHRHSYKGVGMTVAHGKRLATKRRNRLRHKKHWHRVH